MTRLDQALQGIAHLGFDTSPVIYFIEVNPKYEQVVTEVFRRIEGGTLAGTSSVITLTEVLVQPLRNGNVDLRDRYASLLTGSEHFTLIPIDAAQATRAADLRAQYGLRTPDAIQLATAMSAGCEAFLTNDATLRRVTEIPVLLLDELCL